MNAVDFSKPIRVIDGLNGLWARGVQDACPPDHFTECFNCVFTGNSQVRIRPAMDYSGQFAGKDIISFFSHLTENNTGQATGKLILTADGDLYDDTLTLLKQWPGADDFAALNIYGRVFLSPKRLGRALPGEFTYYYDGVVRKFGGVKPSVAPALADSADLGDMEPGVHHVAISFIYKHGFISPPSDMGTVPSTAGHKIALTSIPLGGSDVVGRLILVSKAGETDLFILADDKQVLKADNTVTSGIKIEFLDTELVDDAGYLYDVLEEVPSCSSIRFYKNRIVLVGISGEQDIVLLSNVSEPETFNNVDGRIEIPRDYKLNNVNTALVLRDSLYLLKPHGTFVTQDNGDVPNSWSVTGVDSTIGAFDTGVSSFATSLSAQDIYDTSLVCDETGLVLFNGVYGDRLTYKIDALWAMIKGEDFHKVQIAHDPWLKQVYILVPVCDTYALLMMDYKDGLSSKNVKWSIWRFKNNLGEVWEPKKIQMSTIVPSYTSTNTVHIFELTFGGEWIYNIAPGPFRMDLNSIKIHELVSTAPLCENEGSVCVFTALRISLYGSGKLKMRVYNQDRSAFQDLRGFALVYEGQDLARLVNFTNEKAIFSFHTDIETINSWFHLHRIDVFGQSRWPMRPALTQAL